MLEVEEFSMTDQVRSMPDGYVGVTPHLCIRGAAQAIEFYKHVFGAVEIRRMPQPDGRIGHAEIRIGESRVVLSDEYPEMGYVSPKSSGGTSVTLLLYVDNVDDVVAKAVQGGATITRPVANQFYGERMGAVEDPYGHTWEIATRVEEVSTEELKRRAALER
jgi:PhnB protein